MKLHRNTWTMNYVNIIMEGLKDHNPTLDMDVPNETIVIHVKDGEDVVIFRPSDPEDWFYLIEYYWHIDPYGFSLPVAMYNEESFVVDRILRILDQGGMSLTPEEWAQVHEGQARLDREAAEKPVARLLQKKKEL